MQAQHMPLTYVLRSTHTYGKNGGELQPFMAFGA
jgi:hypothetical protein